MNGFLAMYKPTGMTSADVVYKVRKILHMKKVGHSGTLDPNVDGMLPIALGAATKAITTLQDGGKIYSGEVTLGFATTTEDLDGEVVARTPLQSAISDAAIDAAMASFIGTITQIPPMYSAVKVNGRRLYDYARAGETVERPQRQAVIKEFTRVSPSTFNAEAGTQTFKFLAKVGKGTYIRTLAVDLGRKLGLASCMSQLTRQESGGFTLDESCILAQLQELAAADRVAEVLHPIQHAYPTLPTVELSAAQWSLVQNGGFVSLTTTAPRVLLTHAGVLKAVYARTAEGGYHPETMYLANDFGGVRGAND